MTKHYYSNGKLLLTGEYVVLDGATALAIPTKKGQSLSVTSIESSGIVWKSYDPAMQIWYEAILHLNESENISEENTTTTLLKILNTARVLNPLFLSNPSGILVETHLDFPKDWGLGSSSTLINNIAQWAGVDPFRLLQKSFGGSGYDIAAARHNRPIFYAVNNGVPAVQEISLPWDFKSDLFFVHLNQKQDSKEGIQRYRERQANAVQLTQITDLSKKMLLCYTLADFEALLLSHERIIASIIGLPTIQERLFQDYPGVLKSLGAWGGDFILATGNAESQSYFRNKGYKTILPFNAMIR